MATEQDIEKLRFDGNATLRWPCRTGDFLFWLGFKGLLSHPGNHYALNNVWKMRDGDNVLITNRPEDIPSWFELHPGEVCDSFIPAMKKKLDAGYRPGEIMEGANIWRIKAGDLLAWVGKSRTGYQCKNNILQFVHFSACALAVGESTTLAFNSITGFGELSKEMESTETIERCREALRVVQAAGFPRTFSPEWALG